MNQDLFSSGEPTSSPEETAPLAERMRPRSLSEVVGQEALLSEGRFLRRVIDQDQVPSLILWGPPGVGKTTIARVIAGATGSHFVALSAVFSGSYCQKLCMDPSGGDPFSPDSVYKCDVFYDLSQAPVAL